METAGISDGICGIIQVQRLARFLPGFSRCAQSCVLGRFQESSLSLLSSCALISPYQLPASMIMLTKLLSDGALWLSNCYDRVCPSPVPYIKSGHDKAFSCLDHVLTAFSPIPCSDSRTYGYWEPLLCLLCTGGGVLRLIPALALGNNTTAPPPPLFTYAVIFPFLLLIAKSEDVRLDLDEFFWV